MIDLSGDIRCMVLDFGQPVVLFDGRQVSGIPGLASVADAAGCEAVVSGTSRSLTFVTADVPGIKERQTLRWAGQAWTVNGVRYLALGAATVVFLLEA